MSYILDALRRADAERERERGAVPGLHSRPISAGATAPATTGRWALAGLIGLSLVLVGVAAVWWLRPVVAPVATPVGVVAMVPAVPTYTTPASTPATTPTTPPPLRVVVAPSPAPVPVPALEPVKQVKPAAAPASVVAPLPAASAPPRPIPLAQLTPEQRRDWPALTIGGAIYSDNASSRFIMIGGQVVREGEAAAAGVTVERIGPKTAVMRWRDLRVEVPF